LPGTFPSAPSANKPPRPTLIDRLDLWLLSTGRDVDGLWVGSTECKPCPGLQRAEDALRLIKQQAPLHYSRILRNLQRILVDLVPSAIASYRRSLNACVLDERFVLPDTTTLEQIASAIVHEATHARLERWGIAYDEHMRARIEAICMRRELDFLSKLQHSEPLQAEMARKVAWYADNHEWFSDANRLQRHEQGVAAALRHLGTPDRLIGFLLAARKIILGAHRVLRRLAGRA
jgi:hypothetical protein